ncbi:hypothetical protein CORC01_09397 [Colletotrichum orchidophilum]|uniref:Uncharacterized protein n=1 Tax=Colletotrichum orchidophilum TaxID=1209926 RepID=A0A1G4B1R4_9PEZI|nr:uncharacterized protein CORC01_09397 [Colletotrichum orchidophilum]OHE95252.1 hypothetical protein CORC01_09397 [Colletotrichum orchidophilum]
MTAPLPCSPSKPFPGDNADSRVVVSQAREAKVVQDFPPSLEDSGPAWCSSHSARSTQQLKKDWENPETTDRQTPAASFSGTHFSARGKPRPEFPELSTPALFSRT